MNAKENKDDKAAIEYAEKNGCSVAAARVRMVHEAKRKEKSDVSAVSERAGEGGLRPKPGEHPKAAEGS